MRGPIGNWPPGASVGSLQLSRLEVAMADYATLLRNHVTLKCRSIDRIFMQAYVPKLQTVGQVCIFLRWQRGFKIPSVGRLWQDRRRIRESHPSVCGREQDPDRAFQEGPGQGEDSSALHRSCGS